MTPLDGAEELYLKWESVVAFRLFADQAQPTLTVPEQIAASLGDRIIAGAMAPGERIIEQELAAAFQVSRGPIRDAIRILEREQLVTILPRRGAVVSALTADEVREIFEIRGGLHELVARRVVPRKDPQLLALHRAGLARLSRLAELDDDEGAYAETTYRLGLLAARAAGNQRLYRMVSALSLQTLRYSKIGLASRARRQRSIRLWRAAAAAFDRGDVERYVELSRQRIEESGAEAAALLQAGTAPVEHPREGPR